TKSFRRAGCEVIRFIGTGGQAACAPSLHADSGERREWTGGVPGEPAVVEFMDLWNAVCDLAAACGCKAPTVGRPAAPPPGDGQRRGGGGTERRALAYVAKCPGAIEGRDGHSQTFRVARAVVWGFGLPREVGFQVLRDEYNPRCEPPWS